MTGGPSRPEHDPELLREHAVGDAGERLRLLRALADAQAMVTLHAAGDDDCFVVSRIVGVEAARDLLSAEFVTDDGRRDAFRAAGRAIAVAAQHGVRVQFELERVALVGDDAHARLTASLPTRLYRLQRRDAYRVSPRTPARPVLRIRGADGEALLPVLDLSVTGVAIAWPDRLPAPGPDATLTDCRLELPASPPIRCGLRVRAIDRIEMPDGAVTRVGCALDALDPSSTRAIQVWVNDAQTQGRRVRPRLG